MAEYVTITGTSVSLADLQSPVVPDCLEGNEWHTYQYPSHEWTCHHKQCVHVRCKTCGMERIIYSIRLRARYGLADELNKAHLIWAGTRIKNIPICKVLVKRYVAHPTPATDVTAATLAPTPA